MNPETFDTYPHMALLKDNLMNYHWVERFYTKMVEELGEGKVLSLIADRDAEKRQRDLPEIKEWKNPVLGLK